MVVKRFVLLLFIFADCTYYKNQSTTSGEESVLPLSFDRELLESTPVHTLALLREFYEGGGFKLVWSDSTGRTATADSMISIIRSAGNYGLIPGNYNLREIENLTSSKSHGHAVAFDVYLSDAFFTMWLHLRQGRVNPKTLALIDLTSFTDAEAIQALHKGVSSGNPRAQLALAEPLHREYQLLKAALKENLHRDHEDSSSQARINQLVVNLERWRWQKDLPTRHVRVNVPSFLLRIMEEDSIILESKVIVGKLETPTPELNSLLKSFIIYPYWHVPKSIVKEILPGIQEDTLYLRRHNYDVLNSAGKPVKALSIDWLAYDAETFPYVLRQREGSENTMGVIKFIFNNNYGVYLHDTNARGLFAKPDRNLSHGCIRVHKAVDLARYLIKDDYIVSPEDLDQYMQLQHRMEIRLPKPIPLLLTYFTCERSGDEVIFYRDIYKKDEALIRVLHPPIANASLASSLEF